MFAVPNDLKRKPSASEALEAACVYVMLQDGALRDMERQRAHYFADVRAYVLGHLDEVPKTPMWASRICGMDEDAIRERARSTDIGDIMLDELYVAARARVRELVEEDLYVPHSIYTNHLRHAAASV